MCRYGFKKYKPHFVCFDCQKVFKQRLTEDIILANGHWEVYKMAFLDISTLKRERIRAQNPALVVYLKEKYHNRKYICPDCQKEMLPIGKDLKAPPKSKKKEWKIIQILYQRGITFHTCGCSGPGFIPRKKYNVLI